MNYLFPFFCIPLIVLTFDGAKGQLSWSTVMGQCILSLQPIRLLTHPISHFDFIIFYCQYPCIATQVVCCDFLRSGMCTGWCVWR